MHSSGFFQSKVAPVDPRQHNTIHFQPSPPLPLRTILQLGQQHHQSFHHPPQNLPEAHQHLPHPDTSSVSRNFGFSSTDGNTSYHPISNTKFNSHTHHSPEGVSSVSLFTSHFNGRYHTQQPPTSIGSRCKKPDPRWNAHGLSTSAGRRLPFVHRFRALEGEVDPQPDLLSVDSLAENSSLNGRSGVFADKGTTLSRTQRKKKKMNNSFSNPVGALQERFQSQGVAPLYTVTQCNDALHRPTFAYEVSVDKLSAQGRGSSKKQAKHAAAQALLNLLDSKEESSVAGDDNGVSVAQPLSVINKPTTDKVMSNAVSQLQEYCAHKGTSMPLYDLSNVSGTPHNRSFKFQVTVGCHSVTAEAGSKKEAKRMAASQMLAHLNEVGVETNNESVNTPADPSAKEVNGLVSDSSSSEQLDMVLANMISNTKINTLKAKHSQAIKLFYENLGTKGSRLYALHCTPIKGRSSDYVRILADLGKEEQFSVTYSVFDEVDDGGEIQCIVQLSTFPVAVCCGTGSDVQTAKNETARNALNYLKLMTRKQMEAVSHKTPIKVANPANKTPDSSLKTNC